MANRLTKRETTNAIILLEIALLIVLLIKVGDWRSSAKERREAEPAKKEAAQLSAQADSVVINLRPFDPNTVSYEELRAMGMGRREAVSLIKFRATGKVFSIKEDVALCYNLSDSTYSVLAPYITIGEAYRIKTNTRNYSSKPHKYQPRKDSITYLTPSQFRIDTVSESYLRAIGALTKRQAEVFIRWRNQSGFRDMEEVRACYVVDDSIATFLEPYIIFPEREQSPYESPIDINTADSALLIKVIGIGPKTINTIIQYRQQLGGFHSVEQLVEVNGMTESNYEKIVQQIVCNGDNLRKIDANNCTTYDLIHPYINKMHIRKITRQRQLSGGWKSVQEMVDQGIFTTDEAARIAPYLYFGEVSKPTKQQ